MRETVEWVKDRCLYVSMQAFAFKFHIHNYSCSEDIEASISKRGLQGVAPFSVKLTSPAEKRRVLKCVFKWFNMAIKALRDESRSNVSTLLGAERNADREQGRVEKERQESGTMTSTERKKNHRARNEPA